MGRTATIIAVAYSVAVLPAIAAAVLLWRSTRTRRRIDPRRLAQRERNWLIVVAVLLLALLFATIFYTPYGRSAGRGKQVVRVTGVQFAWAIDPPVVRANVPVEFRLRSGDVNHALAVYNSRGVLLFQVQVMPGRTQKAVYTFRKPGVYRVLCLEFCGLDHDLMQSTIRVRA